MLVRVTRSDPQHCPETNNKQRHGGWKNGSTVRALTTAAEDLSYVPSIHVGQFTIACNSSSKRSGALFWLLLALHTCDAHTCMQARHSYKSNNSKKLHQKSISSSKTSIPTCAHAHTQRLSPKKLSKGTMDQSPLVGDIRNHGLWL